MRYFTLIFFLLIFKNDANMFIPNFTYTLTKQVTIDLPYAAVRGEVLPVRVYVFNYLSSSQSATVTLSFDAKEFELKSASATASVSNKTPYVYTRSRKS